MDRIIPFQSEEKKELPTEMEISFLSNNRIYEYGFFHLFSKNYYRAPDS